jgi:hypothetical protein
MSANMPDVLLILHFIGLMISACGAMGSVVSLATARPAARQKGGGSRGPGRIYAQLSIVGLVFLWPTGVGLLMNLHDADAFGVMFWMKMGFVGLLTFAVVSIELVYAGKSKQAGNLIASLGPLAGLSLLVATVFSVLAFH